MRSPFQLSVFVRVRTHCIARCQRSVAHFAHPHRRGSVHEQHDVDAGLRTIAVMPCGLDNARNGERQGGDERQPETKVAYQAEALVNGNESRSAVFTRIGAAPDHLHAPQHEKRSGRGQQPQVQRLAKANRP
jgi:hypothetical protein